MKYAFSRIEARVLPEAGGRENVIVELVVGMNGTDEVSGLGGYRDTLVRLPDPDDESWVPFEEINEEWVMAIATKTAADYGWEDSIAAEIEAAKSKPIVKPLTFQIPKKEE
jgi:hypothetical protein